MRLFVTGASGFIGRRLLRELLRRGDSVVALTRRASNLEESGSAPGLAENRLLVLEGDPAEAGAWQQQVARTDAVLTLAGEPVLGARWSDSFKRRIAHSRVEAVKRMVDTIGQLPPDQRPSTLISASAVGYYGSQGDEELDEKSPPGTDFLARLCVDWEAAAEAASAHGVRVVRLRIGVVLGEGGGALAKMLPAFRAFVGGPLGPGNQYMPWIHQDDVLGLMLLALQRPEIQGPLNLTAPNPVTMKELAQTLGAVLHRPAVLSVPAAALKLALGEAAQTLLGSQRVIPRRAIELGYAFRYPLLAEALRAVVG